MKVYVLTKRNYNTTGFIILKIFKNKETAELGLALLHEADCNGEITMQEFEVSEL